MQDALWKEHCTCFSIAPIRQPNHTEPDCGIMMKLICTVLYPALLICTVLYPALLICTILYPALLICTVLYPALLICTVLYPALLICTVLYPALLICTVLYPALLICTALYPALLMLCGVVCFRKWRMEISTGLCQISSLPSAAPTPSPKLKTVCQLYCDLFFFSIGHFCQVFVSSSPFS